MQQNKLNIGLIGYGKMGKIIEKLAIKRGHDISMRISSDNNYDFNAATLKEIDVAIEFSTPDSAPENLLKLAKYKIPTICGTTAWLEKYDTVEQAFKDKNGSFIYASNFSVGVNAFFAVNKYLATIMNGLTEYDVKMVESHHISKKDAPSGTAVTLADQIIEKVIRKSTWENQETDNINSIEINSVREGDVKGMHSISYVSPIDQIQIKHEAFSREGFALGAIMAAEWLHNKKGIYTMQDVLSLK